ncbi:MAG: hypothetical protein LBT14_11675 [Treponema sp.]|jgi:hypothetical protein|nr:hypothetical protein [Treponema sp.]
MPRFLFPGNNINALVSDNGIFKYAINYPPDDVTGTMTLTGPSSSTITLDETGTATGSMELRPGVYTLSITLNKNNGTVNTHWPIAGTSAAVHIYPGLVTEAAGPGFTFDDDNFVNAVYLAGTVDFTVPSDVTVKQVTVAAYSDAACTEANLITGGVSTIPNPAVTPNALTAIPWFMAIPLSNAGSTFWLKVTITKGDDIVAMQKFEQAAASILRNGKSDFAFPLFVLGGWYVAENRNDDTGTGSKTEPYASVQKALSVVSAASWLSGDRALIKISGEITNAGATPSANGMVEISGGSTVYPLITLQGYDYGGFTASHSIKADGTKRVLYIAGGADVTLENLTLTGGNVTGDGGGVYHQCLTFNISGAALIDQNNAVYLPTNKVITITDALTPPLGPYTATVTLQAPVPGTTPILAGTLIPANKDKFTLTQSGHY